MNGGSLLLCTLQLLNLNSVFTGTLRSSSSLKTPSGALRVICLDHLGLIDMANQTQLPLPHAAPNSYQRLQTWALRPCRVLRSLHRLTTRTKWVNPDASAVAA